MREDFGMMMPGRHKESSFYRYGFQGQERDDEIKGRGNSLNYKYRMHDPRIGRFFAVDPLTKKYPWNSSYAFSENVVINAVELEGLEKYYTNDGEYLGQVGDDQSTRIMTNIASGTHAAKNVKTAIKLVNQLDNKINADTKDMPETVKDGYLNFQGNVYVKANKEIRSHLKNSSIEKYSFKWIKWKLGQFKIGTSMYWSDGPSNFTSKDLGDGKVAFHLPDTHLFILASGFRSGPKGAPFFLHDNSKIKTFTQFLDRVNKGLNGVKKGAQVYKVAQKKVTDKMIEHTMEIEDTLSNYKILYFMRNSEGEMIEGGYGGEYHGLNKAKKAKIMEGIDSISIQKVK